MKPKNCRHLRRRRKDVILLNDMRRELAVLDQPTCELAPLAAAEVKICNGSGGRIKDPHARGKIMLRRLRIGDRIRIISPFSAAITDGEVTKRDEISVTIAWDSHTWGQFYADSPLIWDTLSKLPSR